MKKKNNAEIKNASTTSQSSDRLLQLLECLAEFRGPAKLQEIAAKLNMSQPTVLRYLNSLIQQNYVYKDFDTLRYALTWKICRLSSKATVNSGLRDLAEPFLRDLSNQFDVSSCLVICHEQDLVYIDVIDKSFPSSSSLQYIGKNAPMHTTGSGKVLLAAMSDTQIAGIVESKGLPKLTPKTIDSLEQLIAEIEVVRKQGFAMDNEECDVGIRCVSVPLHDYTSRVLAAMSAYGSVDKMTDEYVADEILPALKRAAELISVRLGYCAESEEN